MALDIDENKIQKNRFEILKNKRLHKICIAMVVLLVTFIVVLNGAEPKKIELKEGDKSDFVIYAPREVIDEISTKRNQDAAANAVTTKFSREDKITNEALNNLNLLLSDKGNQLSKNQFIQEYRKILSAKNVDISDKDIEKILNLNEFDLGEFVRVSTQAVQRIMTQGITEESLERSRNDVKEEILTNNFSSTVLNSYEIKQIAIKLSTGLVQPNMIEDKFQTERAKQEARGRISNTVKYDKGQIIVARNDIVTKEQIDLLRTLNMIKTDGKADLIFYSALFFILLTLLGLFTLYLYNFRNDILINRSELLLLSTVFIVTLLMSWGVSGFSNYLIPFSFAAILISMMFDANLAVFMNTVLTVVIAIMLKGDVNFIYLSLIGGTLAGFAVSKANQRRKYVLAGVFLALVYSIVIICLGVIQGESMNKVLINSAIGAFNGILTIILATGTLPFWESTFNVVTPLKLLELSNQNQPIIKRLLLEAPGTYHHSLLVANLAEVAAEAVGGNSLLARVGAYYHDIGKLKRPYFFKENQYGDNPHERMTPSLSTLVITSHTHDGVEIAQKYGVPLAVQEIIQQHHGTTLVAYFFYKANQTERQEIKPRKETFRYDGPRPTTKEAAVVMLADSVEAAVRSMPNKTEGRIEGLVRKIIKDKLEDGQLDLCDLTLRDLELIAEEFLKVLTGYFHGREEYPDIKSDRILCEDEEVELIDPLDALMSLDEEIKSEEEKIEDNYSEQTEKV